MFLTLTSPPSATIRWLSAWLPQDCQLLIYNNGAVVSVARCQDDKALIGISIHQTNINWVRPRVCLLTGSNY